MRADEGVDEWQHADADPLVRGWIGDGEASGNRRHLGLRFFHGDSGLEPGHGLELRPFDRRSAAARERQRIDTQRQPRIHLRRKAELLRHHADDRRHLGVGSHGAADDRRIAVEAILPGAIAEQHHRRRRRMILLGPEGAAEHRLHAEDVERPRTGVGAEVADRLALGAADVDRLGVERGDVFEAGLLGAPILEVVDAHAHELDALRRLVTEQRHEPIRVVVRQPPDHGHVDDAEHRRGQADPEGQRDDGRDAEPGPADEHPDAVANVTEQGVHGESPGELDCDTRPYVSDGSGPKNVQGGTNSALSFLAGSASSPLGGRTSYRLRRRASVATDATSSAGSTGLARCISNPLWSARVRSSGRA